MLIKKIGIFINLLTFIFLISCYSKKEQNMNIDKELNEKNILNISFMSEANSLDPRYGYEIPANLIAKMLFDGLMRFVPDGSVVPAVASHVEISSDQKTYTFHLRPSQWSNGIEVTSYDFEYAWKGVINPLLGTKGASDFYVIKNVQDVVNGKAPLDTVGIYAPDAKTLIVELEYPAPYFLELTTTSSYSPVYKEGDLKNPKWAEKAGPHFISNGPFILKEWQKNYQFIFEKNPLHWDAENVRLSRIIASVVEDPQTSLFLFQDGKLDWYGKPFSKISLDAVPMLRKKDVLNLTPEYALYWYFINVEKFPFTNKKIRQAFSLCVDRHALTTHLLQENERPASGIVPSFETSYSLDENSLLKAQTLFEEGLNELGMTRENFPEIPLSFCGIEVNRQVAQVIQQQWQKAFNITVSLVPQEWTAYYDNLSKGNFVLGGMSWHSRISDPIYNLLLFKYRDSGLNMSKWENKAYQQLLDESDHETEPQKRISMLHEAEALLMDEMPVIPVFYLTLGYAKSPRLHNVYISKLNQIDFKWAYKE
jgi:oligopeptide transport system substrate-binding protein